MSPSHSQFFLNGLAVAAGFPKPVHDRSLVGFEGGHDGLDGATVGKKNQKQPLQTKEGTCGGRAACLWFPKRFFRNHGNGTADLGRNEFQCGRRPRNKARPPYPA